MSTFAIPRELSRRGRNALFAAFTVIDDTGEVMPEGTPPSALTTMCQLLDHTDDRVREALRDLVEAGLATIWHDWRCLRVRIHLGRLKVRDACTTCGSPARGTGKWCAWCRQHGRDDRAWQAKALDLADLGKSPRQIARELRMPMWRGLSDDGRANDGGAVVPFLLGKGLLGPEWAERLREALRGGDDG